MAHQSCFLAALILFPLLAAENNWPQFRGPSASGVGTGATPLKWNGERGESVLWKSPIPGLGHSSPVIWGDKVFLTTAVSEDGKASLKVGLYGDIKPVEGEGKQSFEVLCFDRKSGKLLWQRTAYNGQPKIKRHTKSTHANPSPATDGKHLIVSFGSEGLYAFDFTGKLLWKKDLGVLDAGYYQVPSAQWGYASSPIIADGKVIVLADVQKDSFVAAFDVATGKELWRAKRDDVPTFGSPALAPSKADGSSGRQIVVNGWKHSAGYDLKTGKEIWSLKGGGDIPTPTPVVSGETIILTSAHGSERPIYAIKNDASGTLEVGGKSMAWKQDKSGNYMQTPLVHDGLGYFCMDSGVLSVFQMATGERLYQKRLGAGNSGFSSSAVAADGKLYITNEEGHTFVLALGQEFSQLAENELGETVMASPAIVDGVLYVRGRDHLYAIGGKR